MNHALKLVRIGNSTGVVLPKEALGRMRVEQGDALFLSETPDGGYRLTPVDPNLVETMELAERIMREDRTILRALAK